MQKQIYFGGYFAIDTTCGTEIVPDEVIGRTVGTDVSAFLDYLEGSPMDDDEVIEHKIGWLARLHMPGYMDCTDWAVHKSEQAASDYLDEMYGEE